MKKIAILFTFFLFCAACQKEVPIENTDGLVGTKWKWTYDGSNVSSVLRFTSATKCTLTTYVGNNIDDESEYGYLYNYPNIYLTPPSNITIDLTILRGTVSSSKIELINVNYPAMTYIFNKQ